jgi:hypothetical protein
MAERATINTRSQWGAETTPGTSVAAAKLLECFNVNFGVKPDVATFRPNGRRWASTQEENREWTEIKIDGNLDYVGFTYLVAGAWGAVTPVTHPTGTTSKDWVWTPPVTGSITPKTYTIEQGDSVRAHKASYCLTTDFGYKGSRKDFSCSGAMIAQGLSDGITMTASPTAVALQPVVGRQVNVYIDPTSAALGTTQQTKILTVEYAYSSAFTSFWPLNRANVSFSGHVDTVPTNTFKFTMEADTQGMSPLGHLQVGDFLYIRVDGQGSIIETTIHYEMQHDMAVKITNIDPFSDSDGVFAIGYEATIMEDSAWNGGQSQVLTLTNLLTAL